jgi:phage virion morphogenesis protein
VAGVQQLLALEAEPLRRALAGLVSAGVHLREPLDELGASLLTSTQQRIQDEETPAGDPWPELAEATQERVGPGGKPRGAEHMLRDRGHLYGSLTYLVGSAEVALGSVREYAAIHQLGGTEDMAPGPAGIPAREFLGLSPEDGEELLAIMLDHLREAVQ